MSIPPQQHSFEANEAPPGRGDPHSRTIPELGGWLLHWKLPLLVLCYVLIYVGIDLFVENIIRHYIYCIVLVVSSIWFAWYTGGKETMLYVTFFNIFFAIIFSRLLYLSGGDFVAGHLFLGKSFLILYIACLLFMAIMIKMKSPADKEKESKEQYILEFEKKRRQLEFAVATQKLTNDLVTQANLVKDELQLLNGAWKSEIHSIINDLPKVKEQELYNQIVMPFQESIITHLRDLETRLSFAPEPVSLAALHASLTETLAQDAFSMEKRGCLVTSDKGWKKATEQNVVLDKHKMWEILLNLLRNSQTALELKQIRLLKEDRSAFSKFKPQIALRFDLTTEHACLHVEDNGGGIQQDDENRLFKEPVPSMKRGGKASGQGTIFVKFFGENMGMEIKAANTDALGEKGLCVTLSIPLIEQTPRDRTKRDTL
jgi:hypothetical protein